jgi:two-component system, cell cycle sensor histidine kinase and response regulator CckA
VRNWEGDRSRETILVVEDTHEVRKMICEILLQQGYHVLEAANGLEALELCNSYSNPIHLLLTDILMPRMNGGELAEHVRRMNPRLPMIFMSGYADDALVRRIATLAVFLAKPFTSVALTSKIREVLDTPAPGGEKPF